MTDKQIIIDGVDVSGCKNLMQGIVPFGCMEDRKTCSCMNNPNCLYKQLKRKEEECKEFRKANDEKNELLAKLGCPTVATARSKVYILENLIKVFKAELEQYKKSKQVSYEEMQKRWQEAEKRSRKLENELSEAKKMLEFYQECFAAKGGK